MKFINWFKSKQRLIAILIVILSIAGFGTYHILTKNKNNNLKSANNNQVVNQKPEEPKTENPVVEPEKPTESSATTTTKTTTPKATTKTTPITPPAQNTQTLNQTPPPNNNQNNSAQNDKACQDNKNASTAYLNSQYDSQVFTENSRHDSAVNKIGAEYSARGLYGGGSYRLAIAREDDLHDQNLKSIDSWYQYELYKIEHSC